MIFLMSKKQFLKEKKKLVEPKDYLIVDATDDDDAELSGKYSNVTVIEAFNPPGTLVKLQEGKDDVFDLSKVEKLEKKFFKGKAFIAATMAITKGMLTKDCNIFIVLRNKAYKYYGKAIKKRMEKLFNVDIKFIGLFSDIEDSKKILLKELSDSNKDKLVTRLLELETKNETSLLKDKDEKKKKKKNKDDDSKKKKKKKKKKDRD